VSTDVEISPILSTFDVKADIMFDPTLVKVAAWYDSERAFCEWSRDWSAGTLGGQGDFGFKVLISSETQQLKTKPNAEMTNGRPAVMALMGMFFQDGLTGSASGAWALYSASP